MPKHAISVDSACADTISCSEKIERPLVLDDWLFFIRDRRWSLKQKRKLLDQLACPSRIYNASALSIQEIIKTKPVGKDAKVTGADIASDLAWLDDSQNKLITITDVRYPRLLKEIYDAPIALFCRGNTDCLNDPCVAIVGSRRPTPVGSNLTTRIANDLAKLGIVVVSGMALGIDAAAHQGTLKTTTPTIGVMGCGLDIVYPARHRSLFDSIGRQGCLVSEYPLGYPPTKFSFPQRNRIVSGLSLGVLIVEAAEKSGTLITARLAMEHNREVMVVPGSAISQQYKGSHRLIRDGAAMVTNHEEILQTLSISLEPCLTSSSIDDGNSVKHPLLEHLHYESTSLDEIILASGLTSAQVSSMLLMLEVEGVVAIAEDAGYVKLC